MTPRQLTFDLPVREALGREDFFVSPANATALAQVENWQAWPSGKLILTGPEGSGKSHLAHVWAALSGARIIRADHLDEAAAPDLATGGVCIEDADRPGLDEPAFFHLHNLMAEAGKPLLVTASTPPRNWNLTLPDLKSRLEAAALTRLEQPDEDLLRAVLLKQFADRQLTVSPRLIDWLLPRIERSLEEVGRIVEKLDSAALADKKPITDRFAARVLDIGGSSGS